jgi:hypothetical protein
MKRHRAVVVAPVVTFLLDDDGTANDCLLTQATRLKKKIISHEKWSGKCYCLDASHQNNTVLFDIYSQKTIAKHASGGFVIYMTQSKNKFIICSGKQIFTLDSALQNRKLVWNHNDFALGHLVLRDGRFASTTISKVLFLFDTNWQLLKKVKIQGYAVKLLQMKNGKIVMLETRTITVWDEEFSESKEYSTRDSYISLVEIFPNVVCAFDTQSSTLEPTMVILNIETGALETIPCVWKPLAPLKSGYCVVYLFIERKLCLYDGERLLEICDPGEVPNTSLEVQPGVVAFATRGIVTVYNVFTREKLYGPLQCPGTVFCFYE